MSILITITITAILCSAPTFLIIRYIYVKRMKEEIISKCQSLHQYQSLQFSSNAGDCKELNKGPTVEASANRTSNKAISRTRIQREVGEIELQDHDYQDLQVSENSIIAIDEEGYVKPTSKIKKEVIEIECKNLQYQGLKGSASSDIDDDRYTKPMSNKVVCI
ncbi:uncharacterized protein [Antedon mediterranea]|uniref:uncharacterized protein n=1 Tax=Antedon mediterranea TaxID=105859 RepID=UPI003AF7BEC0